MKRDHCGSVPYPKGSDQSSQQVAPRPAQERHESIRHAMKKLVITLMLAVTTIARAELTPQQFGQVRDWANREGYIYHGIETSAGVRVFMFENSTSSTLACAPVSSDTADEAINALIGSAALCRWTVVVARQTISEERGKLTGRGSSP